MTMLAGAPVENKGEFNVRMPSGFPTGVVPPPQSAVDVERSRCNVAWHEATKVELGGHKLTGIYEAATPLQGRQPVGEKWVFTCKMDKDRLVVKTAIEFGQVQDIDYFQTFTPTPSSASAKLLAVITNEHGLKTFHLDVAQEFIRTKLGRDVFMNLPGGCSDMSGKIVRLNRLLYDLKQSARQGADCL